MPTKFYLMKAEPDSRVVKGKDVKFSVDDFEAAKTTAWEGVRNHEAKNLMKEMKVGDKVLFYHSNCKVPGIAGFAEVSKEAYPDYTAWDSKHPYYDAKSDETNPKWYMVDATFTTRAANFVPLALLRDIAAASELPKEVAYIGEGGLKAVKSMALVNRGRLSVQRVEEDAWDAMRLLADKGGWDAMSFGKTKSKTSKAKGKGGEGTKTEGQEEPDDIKGKQETKSSGRKRKAKEMEKEEAEAEDSIPRRRSMRRKA